MNRVILSIAFVIASGFANAFGTVQQVRTFPPNTFFGTIQAIDLPKLEIEEIPSGVAGKMLGMFLLKDRVISMGPATVIRDINNMNNVQGYILQMHKQAVAIQPDFQGKAWVIWQLTPQEVDWVKENKLNYWK